MTWRNSRKGTRLAVTVGIALLALACQDGTNPDPIFAPVSPGPSNIGTLLGGPDSILSTASYQYHATYSGLYPIYKWYYRNCTTASVSGCATAWTQSWAATSDGGTGQLHSFYLTYAGNCPIKNLPHFQVRVIGRGFAQPEDTVHKVTKLCSAEPL